MKKKKNPLRLLITAAILITAVVILVQSFRIKNFHAVQPSLLYTSAQPKGMDYTRLLYKYHIATIINLRSPAEHREQNWYSEEITWVRSNGVKYFEMPLDRNANNPAYFPDANMQQQFLAIMANKENLPVLVHDGSGKGRVAMLAAVWLAKNRQQSLEQLLADAVRIKHGQLTEQEINFIHGLFR
ncbi:MAG: tyrosine-protein phosphatase [Sedimentisphaerales bacterium]|jgi:protein tyrosine/serine phosphatase